VGGERGEGGMGVIVHYVFESVCVCT